MSITKSGIVLALCVFSQTVQGAEVRRAPSRGQVRAATPRVTVKRTPRATLKRTPSGIGFADASNAMAPYKEWMIGVYKGYPGSGQNPPATPSWSPSLIHPYGRPGNLFQHDNIKGKVIKKFLQYERQGALQGINLGWTDDATKKTSIYPASSWVFYRPSNMPNQDFTDHRTIAIRYGEAVALGWWTLDEKTRFLVYDKSRKVGINLSWAKLGAPPEWAILGGKPGEPVGRGEDWVILYNLRRRQPLIYFDRTVGGDIGWPDSTRWGTGTVTADASMEDVVKPLLMPGVQLP